MNDEEFELLIQNLIVSELSGQACVKGVERVLERPQRGKDIVIRANGDIRLFGTIIECRSNAGLSVYVECKWSSAPSLSFERIASNAAQNVDSGCGAFVAVTNSFFTVGALWELYKLFKDTDTRLIVVDGTRLQEIIKGAALTDRIEVCTGARVDKHDFLEGVLVRDDVNASDLGSVEITLALENRTAEPRSGRVFLQSDADWTLKQPEADLLVHLPPFGVQAFRLHAVRQVPDRKTSLRLGLDLNGALRSLSREYPGLSRLDFHPDFVGSEHEKALKQLLEIFGELRQASIGGTRLVTIFGPAGTGKSRLVQEIAQKLNDVGFRWLKYDFPVYGAAPNLDDLLHRAREVGFSIEGAGRIKTMASLIESFTQTGGGFGSQIPVLVLEDAHNADAESCEVLSSLVVEGPIRERPLALVLTGRTDHSHGNPDFQRLADLVNNLPYQARASHVTLDSFDATVARRFISEIIRDVPLQVIDIIERLSGRVPAHIVQCIEWLLDMSAVRIVHRGAVGIIDHEGFISKADRLPGTMVALLADRYEALAIGPGGDRSQEVLLAAALLGSSPPTGVFSLAGPDLEAHARELLIGRRFLEFSDDVRHLKWHHENLLIHFRDWLFGEVRQPRKDTWVRWNGESWATWADRGRRLAAATGSKLRKRSALLKGVDRLSIGRLASVAGDHRAAIKIWEEMLADLRGITGYSTADIPATYFEHLRFAYESVQKVGQEPDLLPSILKSMAYIGGYSLSLYHGISAADYGISSSRHLRAPALEKRRLVFWLRCLKAHFILDAGFVRRSQGLLLELQADLEGDGGVRADPHLGFEVYNCLAMLYGYLNHAALAVRCYEIADGYVEELADPRLRGKLVGDKSVLYQYSDFSEWVQISKEADTLNVSRGTVRHRRHSNLNMLCLRLLLLGDDFDELHRINKDLDGIQRDCEGASYFSLMPRVYLLRSAVAYAIATENLSASRHDDRWMDVAQQAADHGLGIGIERGIGFASWQLRNIKAMIALRRGNYLAARQNLQSAVDIMRTDGLLFLGNADLTCPNQIVLANHVKLLHSMGSDFDIKTSLREVRTYDKSDWTSDEEYDYAVRTSLEHDALLGRVQVGSGLARDRKTGLGLVVWL